MIFQPITNDDIASVWNSPESVHLIKAVGRKFKLNNEQIKSCGDLAIWKCLKSHRVMRGNKFTSSLHEFMRWECLNLQREQPDPTPKSIQTAKSVQTLDVSEYLTVITNPFHRSLVEEHFLQQYTLSELGKKYGYSKSGIKKIIDKSLQLIRASLA